MDSSQKPTKARLRFSLAALLGLVTILCLVLSRYYPRVYTSVTVDVAAQTRVEAMSVGQLALSEVVLGRVAASNREVVHPLETDVSGWIRQRVRCEVTDDSLVRLVATGAPKDRRSLQLLVEGIASELLKFLDESSKDTTAEVAQLMREARGKIEDDVVESESQRRLLIALEAKLQEVEAQRSAQPEAHVVDRKSGFSLFD